MLSVDQQRRRIALGLKQLEDDPWATDIPNKYQPGQLVTGTVTKITNFGVFVGLENGLEGLLHISELADHKVENPEEMVKVGDEIEVKILRVDTDERKIGLSRKRVEWAEERSRRRQRRRRAASSHGGAQRRRRRSPARSSSAGDRGVVRSVRRRFRGRAAIAVEPWSGRLTAAKSLRPRTSCHAATCAAQAVAHNRA